MISSGMTILYVSDQEAAKAFYESVFQTTPILDVPGMTEFRLESGFVLGLMPREGIKHLLGAGIFSDSPGSSPGAELYFQVQEAEKYLNRAIQNGGERLLGVEMRDWGDRAGYCLDLDKHVLAFAESSELTKG